MIDFVVIDNGRLSPWIYNNTIDYEQDNINEIIKFTDIVKRMILNDIYDICLNNKFNGIAVEPFINDDDSIDLYISFNSICEIIIMMSDDNILCMLNSDDGDIYCNIKYCDYSIDRMRDCMFKTYELCVNVNHNQ